jgi:hypothetical protein
VAGGYLRSCGGYHLLEVPEMRTIAEMVICIALLLVNRFVVGSRHEERVIISMICMGLAIIVADLM